MNKIEACIFDLDGVIVDTAKYHFLAWRKLADELGFKFTEKDNERLKGVSRMKSLEILLEIGGLNFDDEKKKELAEKKNNWYREYIHSIKQSDMLPGALDFIKKVKSLGIKTALGSVSKNANDVLNALDIKDCFDAVIDGTQVSKAKPDPEVFLKAAHALNTAPEKCVVFEDAFSGIQAAINAGMRNVGIGSPEILNKADMVIPDLAHADINKITGYILE